MYSLLGLSLIDFLHSQLQHVQARLAFHLVTGTSRTSLLLPHTSGLEVEVPGAYSAVSFCIVVLLELVESLVCEWSSLTVGPVLVFVQAIKLHAFAANRSILGYYLGNVWASTFQQQSNFLVRKSLGLAPFFYRRMTPCLWFMQRVSAFTLKRCGSFTTTSHQHRTPT